MNQKGVIVGSKGIDFCDLFAKPRHAYFLGLWCADGYHRSSSIGLSNVDENLIESFKDFLLEYFPIDRLRLRVYLPLQFGSRNFPAVLAEKLGVKKLSILSIKKAVLPTIHIYVNCRSFLRKFQEVKQDILAIKLNSESVRAYFAGRFDGDGSIAKDGKSDCRIVYGNFAEAERDAKLLRTAGLEKSKVYHYAKANTFCLYISQTESRKFIEDINRYSRSQKSMSLPSRDLIH